ncbi:MAG TPA: hypothetical protein VLU73_00395 [Methylococcaceae bacterium]|nr:hypothetical protein [Methylococcaceae bacterium]
MKAATLRGQDNAAKAVLYIAMKLSSKQWKLVLADGVKRRRVTMPAVLSKAEKAAPGGQIV